jgi:cell division septal protein FtsQ
MRWSSSDGSGCRRPASCRRCRTGVLDAEFVPVAPSPATTVRGTPLVRRTRQGFELARIVPSGRSLLLGFALLAGGILAYVVARHTAVFAVRAVEVGGASPALERQVRTALRPVEGRSLLALDADEIERRLAEVPAVASASYDRSFPHTLRVWVAGEHPVAVLRSGPRAWLLSARAKVLQPLPHRIRSLPRLWIGKAANPRPGTTLTEPGLPRAARLVAQASRAEPRLMARVGTVRWRSNRLTFVLRSGAELRLGSGTQLRLKLAVATHVLRILPRAERQRLGYVDLSVPTRPVVG